MRGNNREMAEKMKLRKLELKDAPLMLEWMHDQSVVQDLRTNFLTKTMNDCENFIRASWDDEKNLNLAIADATDIYMGTVSLKNIRGTWAEFGITIRACAMGKGYSKAAMEEILRVGFEELGLEQIYWCVSPENQRAVRFYDKNGYKRVDAKQLKITGGYSQEQIAFYLWYLVTCKNQRF